MSKCKISSICLISRIIQFKFFDKLHIAVTTVYFHRKGHALDGTYSMSTIIVALKVANVRFRKVNRQSKDVDITTILIPTTDRNLLSSTDMNPGTTFSCMPH